MSKFLEKHSALVLRHANDFNYFGKRLKDKRLEVAEAIITELVIEDLPKAEKLEPSELVNWLDDNKPAKPEKGARKAAASNRPAANTIQQGFTDAPALPVLHADQDFVIITAAQNNTAPNLPAWQALCDFAAENSAKIVVMPIWYNKNAFSSAVEDEGERFDPVFLPYLLDKDTDLFENGAVTCRVSAAVPATAKLPVNAAATLNTGELVTVVASTKQQLKTLVRSPSMPIREAWATGAMTQINYTRSRAGSEATSDHVFGAVLIVRGLDGTLYPRNLVYKNGVICDADSVADGQAVAVLGDLHCEMKDQKCWSDTLDFLERVQPSEIVVHDILHFQTASHHNRNDGKHLYKMRDRTVMQDLLEVITDLNTLAEIAPVYVVESNHNSSLDIWLSDISYNPKRDPKQAKLYYLLNWLVCDALDDPEQDGQLALKVAFENLDKFGEFPELNELVIFGKMDESAIRHGYDISQHGHKGQNGSAGSTGLFSRWSFPMVTGHTHSPAILGKVLTVGVTASLQQGYNRGGGSSWNQSHALILPNGTAQIYPIRGLSRTPQFS